MNAIEKDIFVKQNQSNFDHIAYVQSTNDLPIIFHIRDYVIAQGTSALVYVRRPDGTAEYDIAEISGNDVTVNVKTTMFSVAGKNFLQIKLSKGERSLVTFAVTVHVQKNYADGTTKSENVTDIFDETLKGLEEIIQKADNGEFTGTIQIGKVTTGEAGTPASVENVGTPKDAVLNLTIPKGDRGEQGEKGQSGASMRIKGTWTSGTAYVNDGSYIDLVAYEGSAYACKRSHTSSESILPGDETYWLRVAEKGEKGEKGSDGGFIPAGTIRYEELPAEPKVGFLYNISNDFVTDDRFAEGAGQSYTAGNSVYWTVDGKWAVLAGNQSGQFVTDFIGTKEELQGKIEAGEMTEGMTVFLTDGGVGNGGGGGITPELQEQIKALEKKTQINTYDNAGIVKPALKPLSTELTGGYPLRRIYSWSQLPAEGGLPEWTLDWRAYELLLLIRGLSTGTYAIPMGDTRPDPMFFELNFYTRGTGEEGDSPRITDYKVLRCARSLYNEMNYYGGYGRKANFSVTSRYTNPIVEEFNLYYNGSFEVAVTCKIVYFFRPASNGSGLEINFSLVSVTYDSNVGHESTRSLLCAIRGIGTNEYNCAQIEYRG